MKKYLNLFNSSILAGICISIGCIANVMYGGGLIGAVLFTFGLITVVHYGYSLYTGTAGFITSWKKLLSLFCIILVGNVIGCALTSYASVYALPNITEGVNAIVTNRLGFNIWQAFIRAIFCGFLMTTAVKFAKEGKWLPLLFAVPLFIISGFYHSIADSFYFITSNYFNQLKWHYVFEIVGNFIGCNLYRLKFLE